MNLASIINLCLTGLFVLLIVGLVLSIIIGMKRGVFSATYRLVFMLILIITAIITLDPIVNLVYRIPLDWLGKTIVIENIQKGTVYYVPVTNVHDTVYDFLEGYYVLFNTYGTTHAAGAFALSLTGSIIKLVVFIVDMILIAILGTIFAWLLWIIAFKHLVPRLARRIIRVRWLAAIENALKYCAVTLMLLTPFTSFINIANQSLKNSDRSENSLVADIQDYLNIYDSSIFAQTFFNWSVNEDGLTIDAQFLDSVTTSTYEGGSSSIVSEIKTITDVASYFTSTIINGENGSLGLDLTALASTDLISGVFESLIDSDMLMTLIPIAATMALNSDLLTDYVDLRMINMSEVEWKSELRNVEDLAIDIVESGVLDQFMDKENHTFKFNLDDMEALVYQIMDDGVYDQVINAVDKIDDSQLLRKALPTVVYLLKNLDTTGNVSKFLPNTFDEIYDISWGYESYVALSSIKRMYDVDHRIVHALFKQFINKGEEQPAEDQPQSLVYVAREDEEQDYDFFDVLLDNYESYVDVLVGEFDADGNPINVDKYGRTEVYTKQGQKIEGREFCFLDMTIIKYAMRQGLDMVDDIPLYRDNVTFTEDDQAYYDATVNELNSGAWAKNYKVEFKALFNILGAFKNDKELVKALINNDINSILPDIQGNGKYFHIDDKHVNCIRTALRNIDNSKLIYALGIPVARSFVRKDAYKEKLTQFNIDTDVIDIGIVRCRDGRYLGRELCKIVDIYPEATKLSDAYEGRVSNYDILTRVSKEYKAIAKCLDCFFDCELINPTPIEGDNFVKGENYFNILEYAFSVQVVADNGAIFHREELLNNHNLVWKTTWDNNGEITNVGQNGKLALAIKTLGQTNDDGINVLEYVLSVKPDYKKGETYLTLENVFHTSEIIKAFANCEVIKLTLGEVLDFECGRSPSQIVYAERGITFQNVTDWDKEADNLGELLLSVGKVMDSFWNYEGGFDPRCVRDIVTLNDILHGLAKSSMFVDKVTGEYKFGNFLFYKAIEYGTKVSVPYTLNGSKTIKADVIADPKDEAQWAMNESLWGNRYDNSDPAFVEYRETIHKEEWESTYFLAYRDFTSLTREQWISATYVRDFDTTRYVTDEYPYYYDNPQFEADYAAIYEQDELGKFTHALCVARKVLDAGALEADPQLFEDGLLALNDSMVMRIPFYNVYETMKSFVADNQDFTQGYGGMEAAYATYMVSCDVDAMDYEQAAELRAPEIKYLSNFYKAYYYMNKHDILKDNQFLVENMDDEACSLLREAFVGMNKSYVFHRKGSYVEQNDGKYYPTVFQDNIATVYSKCFYKNLYLESSPKDTLLKSDYQVYLNYRIEAESAKNEMVYAKADYIVDNFYKWGPTADYIEEIDELDRVIELAKAISALDNYHGLKTEAGDLTTNFATVDYTNYDNVEGLFECLEIINGTETLYDVAPNGLSGTLDSIGSFDELNLKTVNIYYQYGNPTGIASKTNMTLTAKYTESDLDAIHFLLKENCDYKNDSIDSLIKSLDDLEHADFDRIEDLLNSLNESYIFHLGGPRKVIDSDGYYVNDIANNPDEVTFLQDIFICKICGNSCFDIKVDDQIVGNYFFYNYSYDKDGVHHEYMSEKDAYNVAQGNYTDFRSKGLYIMKDVYDYEGDVDDQEAETFAILKAVASINNGKFHDVQYEEFLISKDLSAASLETILDGESFSKAMTTINDCETIYDIVPNVLHYMFNNVSTGFSSMDRVDLTDVDVYYHYTNAYTASTPDYETRYPQSEIDAYSALIDDYHTYKETFGEPDDLNKVAKLKSIFELNGQYNPNNTLYTFFRDAYEIEGMHLGTKVLSEHDDTKLTVYEQIVSQVVYSSKLSDYINDDAKIQANIKAISELDLDDTAVTTTGYNDAWFAEGTNDEAAESMLKFMYQGTLAMEKMGFVDFRIDNMADNVNAADPDTVSKVLFALNKSDVIAAAVPKFVENAFDGVHITPLVSYNDDSKANYDLTQYQYGGNRDEQYMENVEINNIIEVLEGIAKYDEQNNFIGYHDISQVHSFVEQSGDNGQANLEKLLSYSQKSLILETGTFTVGEKTVSSRGLLMYNVLADEGDIDLARLLVGDNENEKIVALDSLYNLQVASWVDYSGQTQYGLDMTVESKGLVEIVRLASRIDDVQTDEIGNIYADSECIDLLNTISVASYNADGNGGRSYLSSILVGGLDQEIMETEYEKLDTLGYYYQEINFEPESYDVITLTSFDNLNKGESTGLCAALRMADQVEAVKSGEAASKEAIEAGFNAMVYTVDGVKVNSKAATIIYLAEPHQFLTTYPGLQATNPQEIYSQRMFDSYGQDVVAAFEAQGVFNG